MFLAEMLKDSFPVITKTWWHNQLLRSITFIFYTGLEKFGQTLNIK